MAIWSNNEWKYIGTTSKLETEGWAQLHCGIQYSMQYAFGKHRSSGYSMHAWFLHTKHWLHFTRCRNSTSSMPFQTQPMRAAAWDSLTGRKSHDYVIQPSTCSAHRRRLQSCWDTCRVSKDIFMFFSSRSRSMAPSWRQKHSEEKRQLHNNFSNALVNTGFFNYRLAHRKTQAVCT